MHERWPEDNIPGERDQEPGLEPGDIIIALDQKDHAVFTPRGEDLFMCLDIQLVEALCGSRSQYLLLTTEP